MAVSLVTNDANERVGPIASGQTDSLPCTKLGLAGIGVTMTVSPNQTIVIEGDPIDHYYRIVSGTVRLYKAIADGRRQVIDFLGAGKCFGLTGLDRHSYSAEAVSPVTLIRYPKQNVEAVVEANPEIAQALFRLACTELDQAQRQMLLLGRKTADEKIASFLLSLAQPEDPDPIVHLPMSRQDMADYLGLTIETVSRTMSRFKRQDVIDLIGRQHVALREIDMLQDLADGVMTEASCFQRSASAHAAQSRLEA